MTVNKNDAPKPEAQAFTCPHCGVFSSQSWENEYKYKSTFHTIFGTCKHCSKHTIWHNEKMIFPRLSSIEKPNEYLSDEVKDLYNEAALILTDSPRAACGLLRLALYRMTLELGESGNNLNDNIGNLVEKGLTRPIQQAFDIIRVRGNQSLHDLAINLNEKPETAMKLFAIINIIASRMFEEPKKIEDEFQLLPKNSQESIVKRDKKECKNAK